jgi:hypothetical protein
MRGDRGPARAGRARGAAVPAALARGARAAALVKRAPVGRAAALAGLAVVVLLGAAAILGAAGLLGGAGHPARTAAAPRTALVPGSGTRAARWLAGPAGKLLSAVNADLGRLTVAERAADPRAARPAGLRLSADARAALLGPAPPLAARQYRSALAELERAGRSAAQGRMRAAAAGLRAGESTITKVTAVANSPARAGAPAAPGAPVPEPAGQ